MKNPQIIFLSTGAIGDMVIASALYPALWERQYDTGIVSSSFTLELWEGKGVTASTYAYGPDKQPMLLPQDAIVVDIRNYLKHFPHHSLLPGTKAKAHLCQWMAWEALQQCPSLEGILDQTHVSRDDVEINLSEKEVQAGLDWVTALQREHGNKPVVIISPYSTTVNRNIGRQRLDEVVYGLQDSVLACQLTPIPERGGITGTIPVGSTDLRKVAGLLLAADAYLGVDSGPLHMVNGVIQGTEWYGSKLPVQRKKEKVFVVTGSSAPEVVAYEGNTLLQAPVRVCDIAPCGVHGYVAPEAYGERFGKQFHPSLTDKGGCVFRDHYHKDTAACMTAVPSEQIIEAVRGYLRQRT